MDPFTGAAPRRVTPMFVERVWGAIDLAPLFPAQDKPTGEVWFEIAGYPLLVKFIFTTARLSVQVHPKDDYARRHHASLGKTEMWHILRADQDATVGLGLSRPLTPNELAAAVHDGSIVDLMNWVAVQPGDTLFAPAGEIHAIGGGIALCEIQQNSDVTYRLYDYGRPRELHLEHGLPASHLSPYDGRVALPVHNSFFHTESLEWNHRSTYKSDHLPEHLLIVLEGSGTMKEEPFTAGEVWLIPRGASFPVAVSDHVRLLRTYQPG